MQAALNLLKPIYQPFGEDIFCFGKKFLVWTIVSRNIKIKYRGSILGLLWTLITPLAMTCVYYFVFKVILQVRIPNHLIFILLGVLTWNYISQTILEGMESIVGNIGLISKVPIPLQVFPLVGSLTNLVTLLLATPILLGASLFSGLTPSATFTLIPLYGAFLFLTVYSLALILAVLFIKLRDLRHIMGILLQIWFYATPVIYDEKMIPEKYSWVLYLNPFGCLFSDLHSIWIYHQWPTFQHLSAAFSWTVGLLLLAVFVQKQLGRGMVEEI